jgi:hypothetical protein
LASTFYLEMNAVFRFAIVIVIHVILLPRSARLSEVCGGRQILAAVGDELYAGVNSRADPLFHEMASDAR